MYAKASFAPFSKMSPRSIDAINISGLSLRAALHMWRVCHEKNFLLNSKNNLILELAPGTRINVAIVTLKHIKTYLKSSWL